MFIALGGGNFRQEGWKNIDYPFGAREKKQCRELIDIEHNFMWKKPLLIEDESVDIAYSEHCIEHLTLSAAKYLLGDVYRVLKPGAILRLSLPDFDVFKNLYLDDSVKVIGFNSGLAASGKAAEFLDAIATPLVGKMDEAKLSAALKADYAPYYFMDLVGNVTTAAQSRKPGNHLSCWNLEVMSEILQGIGFRKVKRKAPRESRMPELTNKALDRTMPEFSLRIECAK